MEKNGTPASPATALASRVLPVPGGPTRRTPRGMRAPRELNFSGYLRNSTTSWRSAFASSTPATSAKVTTVLFPRNIRARLLPKLMAWLFVPWAWRMKKTMNRTITTIGSSVENRRTIQPVSAGCLTSYVGHGFGTLASVSQPSIVAASPRSGESDSTVYVELLFKVTVRVVPSRTTPLTSPD